MDSIKHLLDTSYVLSKINSKQSLAAVSRAIQLSRQLENDTMLADSYIEMSYVQSDLGNVSVATEYAFNALELYEKNNHQSGMARALMRITWDKLVIGEYENVLNYLYESLQLVQAADDSVTLATVYHMLGAAYNWINKYENTPSKQDSFFMCLDSAIYYDRKAVEIRRKKNIRGLHNTLNNLGMVLQRKAFVTGEGFKSAEMAFKESFDIRKNNHDTKGMAASHINLAQLLRRKGELDKAIVHARLGKQLAEKIDDPFHKRLGYNQLHLIHKNLGNYDSAFFYYKKYIVLQNEAQSATYKTEIKELETRYEVAKKDKEIKLQEQKVQLQRLYLFFTGGLLMLLSGISLLLFKLYQKNKKLSSRNALLIREQNHRMKNNLQIISGLLNMQANHSGNVVSKDVIQSSQLRVQTMGLIHKRLYGGEFEHIYMDDFLGELSNHIIHSFGFDNIEKNLKIVKEKIKPDKATSIGLIVNELVSNSCKYAFPFTIVPAMFLQIIHGKYNRMLLTYKDNGPGIRSSYLQNTKNNSFGLKLISLQVEQLNGKASWTNQDGSAFQLEFNLN
jgi:two-component system, sensor histidine kinase PdtaS